MIPQARRRLLKWDEIERDYGIRRGRLKQWVRRGHLAPMARQGQSYLYLEADVLRAEAARHA